jgi:hypothetical protein
MTAIEELFKKQERYGEWIAAWVCFFPLADVKHPTWFVGE